MNLNRSVLIPLALTLLLPLPLTLKPTPTHGPKPTLVPNLTVHLTLSNPTLILTPNPTPVGNPTPIPTLRLTLTQILNPNTRLCPGGNYYPDILKSQHKKRAHLNWNNKSCHLRCYWSQYHSLVIIEYFALPLALQGRTYLSIPLNKYPAFYSCLPYTFSRESLQRFSNVSWYSWRLPT